MLEAWRVVDREKMKRHLGLGGRIVQSVLFVGGRAQIYYISYRVSQVLIGMLVVPLGWFFAVDRTCESKGRLHALDGMQRVIQ